MKRQRNNLTNRAPRGWSLVEMLVVVALITILLGILINTASESRAPIELTKTTLKAAKGAATEYEVKTNNWINHHDAGAINWGTARRQNKPGSTGNATLSMGSTDTGVSGERFVWAVLQVESSAKIIRSVERDALKDTGNTGGMLDLLDGWGNPIRYAAFVSQSDSVSWDNDLPKRGTSSNPDPFLASAGADGKWGSYDANNKPNADAADNLYSFNLGE